VTGNEFALFGKVSDRRYSFLRRVLEYIGGWWSVDSFSSPKMLNFDVLLLCIIL